jgi:hypothetical protein
MPVMSDKERIREKKSEIPVIIMSGGGDDQRGCVRFSEDRRIEEEHHLFPDLATPS